ncbi:sensor histidine kinase inhibitor, KipI family [Shimia gijangensis]|uniref:Sensor histidine kinase inhibitor, KipI family n=1 Tax=Shimia gijangensis TaxID=1470563 RepID=A0A1M6CIX1_9RHOB|nr:carboxyltransferase domain-containing protein [Shimia gijangensis]SHI60972.1 sensor histidine kinase inhibitor, KipI family [Shimia gijangensis]
MAEMTPTDTPHWPRIRTAGYKGFLISFADRLSEPANRAALAFRDALEQSGMPGIEETSTSLVSTYLRIDALCLDHAAIRSGLYNLLNRQNWFDAALPAGRKLWRVPTVFGTDLAPQLEEAARAAGMTPAQAITSISSSRVRVQTIGFAPGMPYLGELPADWNIPRQTGLTAQVSAAGLCVALRQLVLFPVATPTGWRQIGQTAFRLFRPEADHPFVLRPGDEVLFEPTTPEKLTVMNKDVDGGALSEAIS